MMNENSESAASSRFRAGFSECARLVRQLLEQQAQAGQQCDVAVEQRLSDHLEQYLSSFHYLEGDAQRPTLCPSPSSSCTSSSPSSASSSPSSRSPSPASSSYESGRASCSSPASAALVSVSHRHQRRSLADVCNRRTSPVLPPPPPSADHPSTCTTDNQDVAPENNNNHIISPIAALDLRSTHLNYGNYLKYANAVASAGHLSLIDQHEHLQQHIKNSLDDSRVWRPW